MVRNSIRVKIGIGAAIVVVALLLCSLARPRHVRARSSDVAEHHRTGLSELQQVQTLP